MCGLHLKATCGTDLSAQNIHSQITFMPCAVASRCLWWRWCCAYHVRLRVDAFGGDGIVRGSNLQRCALTRAQCNGEEGGEVGLDAQLASHLNHRPGAHLCNHPRECEKVYKGCKITTQMPSLRAMLVTAQVPTCPHPREQVSHGNSCRSYYYYYVVQIIIIIPRTMSQSLTVGMLRESARLSLMVTTPL